MRVATQTPGQTRKDPTSDALRISSSSPSSANSSVLDSTPKVVVVVVVVVGAAVVVVVVVVVANSVFDKYKSFHKIIAR